MPIDPNIALGYRGVEAPNPLAQYAQVSQIQNAQNQNAMAQYQLAAAKRADEITNVQNELYAKHFDPVTGKLNQNALNADLIARNQAAQIPVIQAKQQELETKAATAQKTKIDAVAEERKFVEGAQRNLSTNPSDANITAWLEDSRLSPVLTAQTKAQLEKEAAKLLAMKPAERTAYLGMQGATTGDIVSKQNNAATVGATIRGQNMIDAREATRIGLEKERVQLAKDEAERKKQGLEALPPKEIQKREAALPAATAAIKGFETKSDNFIKDLEKLRDHPGLDQITGIAAGRLPGVTADGRAAQALYDKIVAKGGFQALQDLRDASKTGGALGNVSNQEGKQLSSSFAAIQRTQDAPDVRAAIDQAIGDIQGSKTRMREAYDSTYSYKNPAAPAGGGGNGVDTSNPLLKP